jgi:hypothetical protein
MPYKTSPKSHKQTLGESFLQEQLLHKKERIHSKV